MEAINVSVENICLLDPHFTSFGSWNEIGDSLSLQEGPHISLDDLQCLLSLIRSISATVQRPLFNSNFPLLPFQVMLLIEEALLQAQATSCQPSHNKTPEISHTAKFLESLTKCSAEY